MARTSDKRSRLVAAADKLIYEQGVTVTTLANIAELSQVPLGNVYYYFKTKEAIILAVITYRRELIHKQIEMLNSMDDSKERLQSLVLQTARHNIDTAKFGDALGNLCQELCKSGGQLAVAAASLLQEIIDWCEKQFTTLGSGNKAKQLALIFVSRLQGIGFLSLIFKEPLVTNQQADHLINWLDDVALDTK